MTVTPSLGQVARYTLLERLEDAGPGELYRARDTHHGRTVVVRLLPADFLAATGERAVFLDGARALAAWTHPNVITVFEAGVHDGCLFLAFEFGRGRSLRAEMSGRSMNVRRAVELGVQIADAIGQAHAGGFLHGGLSPESIEVTAKGHAKIPAVELAARGGFTRDGGAWRLHDYESPEEARGETPDERSDVYSVGAIVYEMLTTRRPMHRGAAAPSASNRHVPPELDRIVLTAVAPNPDSRPQAAVELAAALRQVTARIDLDGDDTMSLPPRTADRPSIPAAAILGAAAAAAAAIIWWLSRS